MDAWQQIRSLGADPFVSTVLAGVVWPWVQAALDRPWWTRGRRIGLLAAVTVVVTLAVWVASSYPWAVDQLAAQAAAFLGVAWAVYQALAGIRIGGVRLLDWVGVVTPGGEVRGDYEPRHRAGTGSTGTDSADGAGAAAGAAAGLAVSWPPLAAGAPEGSPAPEPPVGAEAGGGDAAMGD